MEFFLYDQNVKRLPPADTRFLEMDAEVSPDGKRVRVTIVMTPSQQRPYLELTLIDSAGNIAATTSVIEPVDWKLELNLHVRVPIQGTSPSAPYKLIAILSFPDLGEIDHRDLSIDIPNQ